MRFLYLALIAGVIFVGIRLGSTPTPTICGNGIDPSTSPNGAFIAEILHINCQYDDGGEFRLSVRRADQSQTDPAALFLPITHPDSIGVKWLGDKQLLVASHRSEDVDKTPKNALGVSITYATFPSNAPEDTLDGVSKSVTRRAVVAKYDYKTDHGIGGMGAGCYLMATINEISGVDRLNIQLVALKTSATKAWVGNILKDMPVHYNVSIHFLGYTDYSHPLDFITSAAFDTLRPEPKTEFDGDWNRNRIPLRAPAGNLAPAWQIGWSLEPADVLQIVDKLRTGKFHVELGYWLENRELNYAAQAQTQDSKDVVDTFYNCLKTNSFPLDESQH